MALETSDDYLVWEALAEYRHLSTRSGLLPDKRLVLAHRRAITTKDMISGNGAYTASDVKFLIPRKPILGEFIPKPGDEIEDDDDQAVYTILEVMLGKFKETWHCISRDLAIAHQLRDLVTIQKAAADIDAIGAVRRERWDTLYDSLPCRFQPANSSIETERGVEGQVTAFQVPISRQLPGFNVRECRLVVVRSASLKIGTILDVDSYTQAERIGDLPIIQAKLKA